MNVFLGNENGVRHLQATTIETGEHPCGGTEIKVFTNEAIGIKPGDEFEVEMESIGIMRAAVAVVLDTSITFVGDRIRPLNCPFCGCAVDVIDINEGCNSGPLLTIYSADGHSASCPFYFEPHAISVGSMDEVPEMVNQWNTRTKNSNPPTGRLLLEMSREMRHTLGLDCKKRPFRNRYVGETPGMELATSLGFCTRHEPISWCPDPWYTVTELGAQFIGITPKDFLSASK